MKNIVLFAMLLFLVGCNWASQKIDSYIPPQPVVDSTHLSLIIVHDPLKWTPQQGRLLTNETLRSYLDSKNHDIRLVYRDQEGEDLTFYFSYLNKEKNVTLPWLLVSKGRSIVSSGPLPKDTDTVFDIVHKYEQAPTTAPVVIWAAKEWRKMGLLPPKPNLKARWAGKVYAEDTPDEPLIARKDWVNIDLSRFDPEVLNQDSQSSCCPCATIQMSLTLHAICGYKNERWSVADLYRRGNSGRDDGMTLEAALELMEKEGVCSTDFADMWSWQKPKYKKGYEKDRAKHKILKPFLCPTIEHIGSAIQRSKPIVIGINVSKEFEPDANGFIAPKGNAPNIGGHALHVVGVFIREGQVYFKIRNSWGSEWGKNGEAYIHESWIEPMYGAWTAAVTADDPDDLLGN